MRSVNARKAFWATAPEVVPEEWALSSFFSSTSALLCGFRVEGAFLSFVASVGFALVIWVT